MMALVPRLRKWVGRLTTADWVALGLAGLFTAVFFWLNSRHYVTFNLYGPDVAIFNQGMWNTVNGGPFLYSSIIRRSVLGFHFTPIFGLLSPLLLLWEDVRIFFLVQIIGLAVTGLILYWLVARRQGKTAVFFLLAFYLNPTLHEIAVHELRRVTLAMPFLALALYGLHEKRRWLTGTAVFFALLCKEDISIIVFMLGVYLLLWERAWRWGSFYLLLGAAWAVLVPNVVIPMLAPADVTDYPQLGYFAAWGNSPQEMIVNVLSQPWLALTTAFDASGLAALGRVFLPLGLLLPFLAPQWALLAMPMLGLLLLSSYPQMHQLEDWYMAPVLPILFFAVAAAIHKLPPLRAKWATGFLLLTALVAFFPFSYVPPGAQAKLSDYRITDHHRRADAVLALIPDEATVATQAAFLPKLSYRAELYQFPWYSADLPIEYYLFDPILNPYPLNELELINARDDLVVDPDNVVVAEVDNIFLLRVGGEQQPAFAVDAVAEGRMRLERVEVALADEVGWYRPVAQAPVVVTRGQQLRVTLYWEALAAVGKERTVSVRALDGTGRLVGQMDMMPNQGKRPTSWWEPGWRLRDTYYLAVGPEAQVGAGTLELLLYDSFSQERVPFGDQEKLLLLPLEIR